MAFHDVRLAEHIERGAQGGPQFKTTIFPLSSGQEKRNIDWERTRGRWEIGYGVQNKVDFSLIKSFFYTRQGMAHSFRFKDWSDFEIDDQVIGSTDGSTTTFQLYKRYSSGGINFNRVLEKPVASDWVITVNAVSQTVVYDTSPAASEVAIATDTGIITLGSTHAATSGQSVDMTGEFDVPVRFDTDEFNINLLIFNAGSIPDLPIVEVRGE
jgi:uncharacterized protein (TIGR02217 family)